MPRKRPDRQDLKAINTLIADIPQPSELELRAEARKHQELMASTRGDYAGTPKNLLTLPHTNQQRVLRVWEAYNSDPLFGRLVNRSVEFAANGAAWEVPGAVRDGKKTWWERVKEWGTGRQAALEHEEDFWAAWTSNINVNVPNVIPGEDEVSRWAVRHFMLSGMFVPHWKLGMMKFGKQEFLVPKSITCHPGSAVTLRRPGADFFTEEVLLRKPAEAGGSMREGTPAEASPTVSGVTPPGMGILPPMSDESGDGATEGLVLKYNWTPGDLVTLRGGTYNMTGRAIYPYPPFASLLPQFLMRQKLFASDLAILDGLINYIMCVRPDQRVTTRRGHVPIASVQVGDEVLTHRGRWRSVTQVMVRPHHGQLTGLTVDGAANQTAWITSEHPIYARKRKKYPYWSTERQAWRWRIPREAVPEPASWHQADDVEAGDLAFVPVVPVGAEEPILRIHESGGVIVNGTHIAPEGRRKGHPHYKSTPIPREVLVDPDLAEVLGLYLAEGHVSGPVAGFSFHIDEKLLQAKTQIALQRVFGLKACYQSRLDSRSVQLFYSNQMLARTLSEELGKGAANKRVPLWLAHAPVPIVAAWIRGLFLGDGHCAANGGWSLKTISTALAYQTRDALGTLGISASIGVYKIGASAPGRDAYTVTVAVRSYASMKALMDGETPHPSTDEGEWRTVRTPRQQSYTGPVYNLEVEEDHSYVVEGIAVHNCWKIGDKDHPPEAAERNASGAIVKEGTISLVKSMIRAAGREGPAIEMFVPYYVDLVMKMPDTSTLLSEAKYIQSTIEILQAFGLLFARSGSGSRGERMERINITNFEEFLNGLRHHVAAFWQMMAHHIVALNPGKLSTVPVWVPMPLNTKNDTFITQLINLAKLGKVSLKTLLRYHGLDDSVELRRIAGELGTDVDDITDAHVPTSYVQNAVQPDAGGSYPGKGDGDTPPAGTRRERMVKQTRVTPGQQQGRPKKGSPEAKAKR